MKYFQAQQLSYFQKYLQQINHLYQVFREIGITPKVVLGNVSYPMDEAQNQVIPIL